MQLLYEADELDELQLDVIIIDIGGYVVEKYDVSDEIVASEIL